MFVVSVSCFFTKFKFVFGLAFGTHACAAVAVFCTVRRERTDRLDLIVCQKMQKHVEKKISH